MPAIWRAFLTIIWPKPGHFELKPAARLPGRLRKYVARCETPSGPPFGEYGRPRSVAQNWYYSADVVLYVDIHFCRQADFLRRANPSGRSNRSLRHMVALFHFYPFLLFRNLRFSSGPQADLPAAARGFTRGPPADLTAAIRGALFARGRGFPEGPAGVWRMSHRRNPRAGRG